MRAINLDQSQSPVSELIRQVESGDANAELKLWNQFYELLLRYVEGRVRQRGVPTGMLDEEAVTASVLESVFKCAKLGRLQNVQDWGELSRLLLAMTNRKFVDHWRRATTKRASPGAPFVALPEADIHVPTHRFAECSLDFEEQLSRLLGLLPDELHRQIAVLKLAEYTLNEIGEEVGKSVPTVDRKWRNIRGIWADELERD
jgi:DNA-directed RNA polymerase specialized sigma24 family protein